MGGAARTATAARSDGEGEGTPAAKGKRGEGRPAANGKASSEGEGTFIRKIFPRVTSKRLSRLLQHKSPGLVSHLRPSHVLARRA